MKTFNILCGLLLLLLASSSKAQNSQESKEFGSVKWNVKDLRTKTFLNGETIKQAKSSEEWAALCEQGKPAWCYYQLKNEDITGTAKLYNWYALTDPRGILPLGWKIPSQKEWEQLQEHFAKNPMQGDKNKIPVGAGSESSGLNFTNLGYRDGLGTMQYEKGKVYYWSTSECQENSKEKLVYAYSFESNSITKHCVDTRKAGFMIRCISMTEEEQKTQQALYFPYFRPASSFKHSNMYDSLEKLENKKFLLATSEAHCLDGKISNHASKNLKYPTAALEAKISGQVLLQYVVTEEGKVEQIKVTKSLGYGCDEEAQRLLKEHLINWKPAKYLEKNVSQLVFEEVYFSPPKIDSITTIQDLINNQALALNEQSEISEFQLVDVTASYPGGIPKFYEFIRDNLNYPKEAKKNKIQGKVFVQFTINRDGSISDVTAIKGIGYGCDEEAVRVVSLSPKWIPAQKNGQAVKQKLVIPIDFGLK